MIREPVRGLEPLNLPFTKRLLYQLSYTGLQQTLLIALFIPKLLLNALTRPQEVHWTQSIITLTTSRCQAFFNMRLSSFPIQDGFYSFKPFQRRASWCSNAAQQSNLTVAISRTLQ